MAFRINTAGEVLVVVKLAGLGRLGIAQNCLHNRLKAARRSSTREWSGSSFTASSNSARCASTSATSSANSTNRASSSPGEAERAAVKPVNRAACQFHLSKLLRKGQSSGSTWPFSLVPELLPACISLSTTTPSPALGRNPHNAGLFGPFRTCWWQGKPSPSRQPTDGTSDKTYPPLSASSLPRGRDLDKP